MLLNVPKDLRKLFLKIITKIIIFIRRIKIQIFVNYNNNNKNKSAHLSVNQSF